MKADKEFKQEFNQELANTSYAGRKIGVRILIVVVIFAIMGTLFAAGLRYFNTNADRIIFKQSIAYNEGKLDDLAKYRLEFLQTEDPVERKAIQEYVNSTFANFDESKIENKELRDFLRDCRNGVY